MSHLASHDFWRCFGKLPAELQELTEKTFSKIKSDPQDPTVHFKKIVHCWSVRIGAHHRALAVQVSDRLVWFWIGNYFDYAALVSSASPTALRNLRCPPSPFQKTILNRKAQARVA
jgi:hypothetical protein